MLSSWNALLVGMQTGTDTEENTWQFLVKVNAHLQCDPATFLLGIGPRELKTYVRLKTWIQIFIAVLLILSKYWKQPRWPSLGKWINALGYINTVDCYSTTTKTKLLFHAAPWADLQDIVVNEQTQAQKVPYVIVPLCYILQIILCSSFQGLELERAYSG